MVQQLRPLADAGEALARQHRLEREYVDEVQFLADTRKPSMSTGPIQLSSSGQGLDQTTILDALVQTTACSNKAIRDLLGAIAYGWQIRRELAMNANPAATATTLKPLFLFSNG